MEKKHTVSNFYFWNGNNGKNFDWLLHMNEEISEEEQQPIETDATSACDHPPQYLLDMQIFTIIG